MDKNLPTPFASSADIIDALRTVVDIPDGVTRLYVDLRMQEPPVIHCTFHPFIKNDG